MNRRDKARVQRARRLAGKLTDSSLSLTRRKQALLSATNQDFGTMARKVWERADDDDVAYLCRQHKELRKAADQVAHGMGIRLGDFESRTRFTVSAVGVDTPVLHLPREVAKLAEGLQDDIINRRIKPCPVCGQPMAPGLSYCSGTCRNRLCQEEVGEVTE